MLKITLLKDTKTAEQRHSKKLRIVQLAESNYCMDKQWHRGGGQILEIQRETITRAHVAVFQSKGPCCVKGTGNIVAG